MHAMLDSKHLDHRELCVLALLHKHAKKALGQTLARRAHTCQFFGSEILIDHRWQLPLISNDDGSACAYQWDKQFCGSGSSRLINDCPVEFLIFQIIAASNKTGGRHNTCSLKDRFSKVILLAKDFLPPFDQFEQFCDAAFLLINI